VNHSETLDKYGAAMAKAQAEFPGIAKGRTAAVGKYSYKYADLTDILEAVTPVLNANGLTISQSAVSDERGGAGVTTICIHASGQWVSSDPLFLSGGSTPQNAGSAITYARRYSLCAFLGIAADDDDDGAKASAPPPTQSNTTSVNRGTGGTTADSGVKAPAASAAELACPECGGPAEYRGSSKTLFYCPNGHGGKL